MTVRHGKDYATGKQVRLDAPEESVRQDFERVLVDDYGYLKSEIEIEVPIPRGSRAHDHADIGIFRPNAGRDPASDLLGLVETKKPGDKSGKTRLKSYMTATSALWGVWTNGEGIEYYYKPPGQSAIHEGVLNNIPVRGQRIEDVGKLAKDNLKPYSRTGLKLVFRRILNTLYANTNISRREKLGNEMIKLIFAKIRDETTYPNRPPAFRVGFGEAPEEVKKRIVGLFDGVVAELARDGVFEEHDTITLDAKGVAWAVGQLERGSLTDTPTDVVGDAFEVFAESKLVGEKGEFFTPRGVIDIAVRLVDPKPDEVICDPACGSGGFLISAMRWVWDRMDEHAEWRDLRPKHLAKARERMAARCFFGIDKESDLVRIAKAYMAISGDGRSNIVHQNALHRPSEFGVAARSRFVTDGAFKLFDCVLTNPPYGTKTKVLKEDSRNFDLGHTWKRTKNGLTKGSPRDQNPYVLFVERCFDMLKEGGRLAIVLPETAFHAPSMEYLRQRITTWGRVFAVIDLPHNTFRPHCNAKTCLLIVEKGRVATPDDRVIMAEAVEMGHDHGGKPLYRPGTQEIWNDLPVVLEELSEPDRETNEFVLTVPWSQVIEAGNWIPRYHVNVERQAAPPEGRTWIALGELEEDGIVSAWDGHGSPSAAEKGLGQIPYFRVADVVNWELYRNPTSGVTQGTFEAFTAGKELPAEGDVLFVRRGSYRIGTVAMASSRDRESVLTKELLTLRVGEDNGHGITPYYLLALLSSEAVQEQIPRLTFIDTTLPNIGDRWRELKLPIHRDVADRIAVGCAAKSAIEKKWAAQLEIDEMRQTMGGMVT